MAYPNTEEVMEPGDLFARFAGIIALLRQVVARCAGSLSGELAKLNAELLGIEVRLQEIADIAKRARIDLQVDPQLSRQVVQELNRLEPKAHQITALLADRSHIAELQAVTSARDLAKRVRRSLDLLALGLKEDHN